MTGIESIISLKDYEEHDYENAIRALKGEATVKNPINSIVFMLMMRARANSHRHYEIYSVKCDASLDKEFWEKQWKEYPQETADLVRSRGYKIFGEPITQDIKIR